MGNHERSCVAVLIAGLLTSTSAFAQGATENGAAADSEILVTAQRREERLVDVPASVVVATGDQLQERGVVSFDQIGNVAPSMNLSRTGVQAQPAIRGITSRAAGPGADNNVAVYVDGFYQPEPLLLNNDLVNVANIQVLAGPQGALYGRNATAGAILIATREPNPDRPTADIELSYGSRNDVRANGYAGIPIGDKISVGINGYYRTNDGYLRKTTGEKAAPLRLGSIQAKLNAEPSDRVKLTFGYNYYYVHDARGLSTNVVNLFIPGVIPPVGLEYTNLRDVTSQGPVHSDFVGELNEETFKAAFDTTIGKFTARASHGVVKYVVTQDLDYTTRNLQWYRAPTTRKYTNGALDYDAQVMSNLDVLAGGMYYKERASNDDFRFFVSGALFQNNFATLQTRALATYLDATLRVGDSLYLTAGARQSWERKTVSSSTIPAPGTGPLVIIARPTTKTFKQFTPRANIRYELSPSSSLYASFTKGFKSGTFNAGGSTRLSAETPVNPETVTAFEVGYKLAQSSFHFELAAFHYDYKNLQVNSFAPLGPNGTQISLLTNAASARSYGAEALFGYEVAPDLNLRLNAAYTHSRYRSFPNANATLLVNGRNVAGFILDLSGRRLANAPDWKINGGIDYTARLGDHSVKFTVNGVYTSEYAPTSETYEPTTGQSRFYQDGFFIGSASADWMLPGDRLTIGVYAQNFTNQRFKLNFNANGQGTSSVYNEPRAFGVKLGYRY